MLKHGRNKTTAAQDEWSAALSEYGYRAEVCYEAEGAIAVLQEYLGIRKENA